MLKINYAKTGISAEKYDQLIKSVRYEKNLMVKQYIEDAISKLMATATNTKKTKEEQDAARAKIVELQTELDNTNKKLTSLEPVYNEVLTNITSAKNEHAQNSKNSVRNLLRLTACADCTKLFKYCIIGDYDYNELAMLFNSLHDMNEKNFTEDGARKFANAGIYKELCDKIKDIARTTFSLPIASDYTDKINIKFNNQSVAILHEIYIKDVRIVLSRGKEKTFEGYAYKSLFNEVKEENGDVKMTDAGFKSKLAQIAVKYIAHTNVKATK